MPFPSSALRAIAISAGLFAAGAAAAAGPSTAFTLSGAINRPASFGLADLQALPAVTQTVIYTAAGVPQTRTYTGSSLWGLVDGAGVVNNPAVNNDGLNKVVTATGSDGYRVVFALGELNPAFGNRPDLVAYAETTGGVSAPLGADGFARITAPGDIRGGRYVSNLVNVDVRGSASTVTASGGGVSGSFSVSGDVLRPATFDRTALLALPALTRVANGVSYTGVSFWDLLNTTVGLSLNPSVNNDVLGKYVVATGSDGYKVVFSLGELNRNFGNQPDLIAYDADGVPLAGNGFARLVAPNDVQRGRWLSNLVSLEVLSAAPVPEPGTAALLAVGSAAVGWVGRRRRARGGAAAADADRART